VQNQQALLVADVCMCNAIMPRDGLPTSNTHSQPPGHTLHHEVNIKLNRLIHCSIPY
jgi:hypothetical protein